MNVRTIIFEEESVVLEYLDEGNANMPMSHQLQIPLRLAMVHQQLGMDLQELMEDAQTLLDSALAVRVDKGR